MYVEQMHAGVRSETSRGPQAFSHTYANGDSFALHATHLLAIMHYMSMLRADMVWVNTRPPTSIHRTGAATAAANDDVSPDRKVSRNPNACYRKLFGSQSELAERVTHWRGGSSDARSRAWSGRARQELATTWHVECASVCARVFDVFICRRNTFI